MDFREMSQLARLTALETERLRLETEIQALEPQELELEQSVDAARRARFARPDYGDATGPDLHGRQEENDLYRVRGQLRQHRTRLAELNTQSAALEQEVSAPGERPDLTALEH